MKFANKFIWTSLYLLFIVVFLCSSCAYVQKVGTFEPEIKNGWSDYSPKYIEKRFYFISEKLVFEIFPIYAGTETCSAGFILPIIPIGSCSDPRFTAERPIAIEFKILSEDDIDIDAYENFKPIIITSTSTYSPIPENEKVPFRSGGYFLSEKPKFYKYNEKTIRYEMPISYQYSFRFYYQIPENNLKRFLVEFPVDFSGIILPSLSFKLEQEKRTRIFNLGP